MTDSEFVAVEMVPSLIDESGVGIFEQLRRAAEGLIKPRWVQFREGFETHPITSIFLATLASLAFLPIVAAATVSLFIVVFITCAAVFGGLFLVILLQLALAIALAALLALLSVLAGGVTASLVGTVLFAQHASRSAAHLRARCSAYDWQTRVAATSAWVSARTPEWALREVQAASAFLKSVPERELAVRAGELLPKLKGLPFPSLPPSPVQEKEEETDIIGDDNAASSNTESKVSKIAIILASIPPFLVLIAGAVKSIFAILKTLLSSVDSFLTAHAPTQPCPTSSSGESVTVKGEEQEPEVGVSTSVRKGKGKDSETTLNNRFE